MIQAQFSGEEIISTSPEAFSLYEKSRYGEKKGKKIIYSPVEALFLSTEEKITLTSGKKELNEEQILRKIRKIDKKAQTKLAVFKDLRKKGYIVKTALKFGAEFRIYDKGIKPGQDHAKWILYSVKESETLSWHEFAAKNRVAHSTKKNLLIGIVDDENDVSYYEISWKKP